MVVLSLIGETLPDVDQRENAALLRALTASLGALAPRGCSLRLLLARGRELPMFQDPRVSAEAMPLRPGALPLLWQNGASARPLDGELMHAVTPLAPLRSRTEEDGSQTTVTVQHMLPWQDPDRYSPGHLRAIRAFIKRAVKLADVVVTPNYATADLIREYFGPQVNVQVLPLAPLPQYVAGADRSDRASALRLPNRYLVTTARHNEVGRLDWLARVVRDNPELPPVVVIGEIHEAERLREAADRSAKTEDAGQDARPGLVADTGIGDFAAGDPELTPVGAAGAAAQFEIEPRYQLPSELENHPNLRAQTTVGASGHIVDEDDSTGDDAVEAPQTGSDGEAVSTGASSAAEAVSSRAPSSQVKRSRSRGKALPEDPAEQLAANSDGRVLVVHPRELADVGAILAGAELLVLPQSAIGAGHEVYGAIANGVPVLHAELECADEIALDAGRTFSSQESLAETLKALLDDPQQMQNLRILAEDRANFFSWQNVAWSLWELHANL